MKRMVSVLLVIALLLTGCTDVTGIHDVLKSGENSYKTAFYGSLYANDFELTDETVTIDNIALNRIKHESLELYCAKIGLQGNTIYCAEKDYQKACEFYSNPKNYFYFCVHGTNIASQYAMELFDVDTAKFDALLDFAEKSTYKPFDKKHNNSIEKVELPMPNEKQTRLVFYKESSDHLFISSMGTEYYIVNNHLYLVYQYDFGKGKYEKLIAVKVPRELSDYFIEYMNPYL